MKHFVYLFAQKKHTFTFNLIIYFYIFYIYRLPKDLISPINSNNIKSVVEQYMLRITDLEDRLKQIEDELNQANSEKEHWSRVA